MSDIVERLRETIVAYDEWYQGRLKTSDTLLERFSNERKESADEITRLREENEKLRRYENLIKYIASEYHELSWEKVISQRDHWKKECKKLIEEDND